MTEKHRCLFFQLVWHQDMKGERLLQKVVAEFTVKKSGLKEESVLRNKYWKRGRRENGQGTEKFKGKARIQTEND